MSYKDRLAFSFHIPTKIVLGIPPVAILDPLLTVGLPQKLSEVSIPKENLAEVAKTAVADPAMRSNIRKVTDPGEIVPVLLSAW